MSLRRHVLSAPASNGNGPPTHVGCTRRTAVCSALSGARMLIGGSMYKAFLRIAATVHSAVKTRRRERPPRRGRSSLRRAAVHEINHTAEVLGRPVLRGAAGQGAGGRRTEQVGQLDRKLGVVRAAHPSAPSNIRLAPIDSRRSQPTRSPLQRSATPT